MGRTKRTQVALYLDAEKVEQLGRAAKQSGRTQQDLLRSALDKFLDGWEWKTDHAASTIGRKVSKLVRKKKA